MDCSQKDTLECGELSMSIRRLVDIFIVIRRIPGLSNAELKTGQEVSQTNVGNSEVVEIV